MEKKRKVILAGPFPPPTHGASKVTQLVAKILTDTGIEPFLFDISSTGTGFIYHFNRILRFVKLWLALPKFGRNTIVYISLSGGLGLFYDLVSCIISNICRHKLIIHHHSYAYIDRDNAIVRIISHMIDEHIFLSHSMSVAFKKRYRLKSGVVVSNLAFFPVETNFTNRDRPLSTIGYLSNISFEKGIARFLTIVEMLRANGSQVAARIAGPVTDPEVAAYIRDAQKRNHGLEYIGPVYGQAKADFFASIDYFVFPSLYINEAQPMVIYEAQSAGLPVATTNRGSLADMLGADDTLLDPNAEFLNPLVERLLKLEADPDLFSKVRARCFERQSEMLRTSRADLDLFIGLFI
ncbi:glycosyltransferase family 4 protein [Asticcacaulis sp. W401b]|uniref:glycosyltransferase family 4 protein n=1 Tax=Asticcacaulis sp. W401b TaxID=3388666 RepID=UPI0039711165